MSHNVPSQLPLSRCTGHERVGRQSPKSFVFRVQFTAANLAEGCDGLGIDLHVSLVLGEEEVSLLAVHLQTPMQLAAGTMKDGNLRP